VIVETVQVDIARPISEVFEFLTDAGNHPRWDSGSVVMEPDDPGPWRTGLGFREVRRIGPRSITIRSRIAALQAPTRMDIESITGPTFSGHWRLSESGGVTRLRWTGRLQFRRPAAAVATFGRAFVPAGQCRELRQAQGSLGIRQYCCRMTSPAVQLPNDILTAVQRRRSGPDGMETVPGEIEHSEPLGRIEAAQSRRTMLDGGIHCETSGADLSGNRQLPTTSPGRQAGFLNPSVIVAGAVRSGPVFAPCWPPTMHRGRTTRLLNGRLRTLDHAQLTTMGHLGSSAPGRMKDSRSSRRPQADDECRQIHGRAGRHVDQGKRDRHARALDRGPSPRLLSQGGSPSLRHRRHCCVRL
jgi:hypothetical protein